MLNRLIRICAACDFPATNHTNLDGSVYVMADGFKIECPRDWYSIDRATWVNDSGVEFSDYYVMIHSNGLAYHVLPPDVSGTEAQSGSALIKDRDATADRNIWGIGADDLIDPNHNPDLIELAKVDRWNDATYVATSNSRSWVSTSVLGEPEGEYRLTQTSDGKRHKEHLSSDETITHEQRNAYVEGNDGFLSLHLLDEQLTKKYHAKLLNVFLDKNTGDVRIGSIRIIKNTDGTITARCVNAACSGTFGGPRASITINPDLAVRSEMEAFVLAIVGHGNNHAAAWFKTRGHQSGCDRTNCKTLGCEPTFYKVHKPGCNINACGPDGICTSPVVTEDPSLNEVEFLMEHQSYCRDSRCKCDDRLSELVGDLNVNAHIMQSAS